MSEKDESEALKFHSIIESGLSPQGGACFTLERKLPDGTPHYTSTCLGGVIAGKTTNAALTLDKENDEWVHKEGFQTDAN